MNQENGFNETVQDDQVLKDMIFNFVVNRFSDDLQFIKKLNKITFGLMTDNDR